MFRILTQHELWSINLKMTPVHLIEDVSGVGMPQSLARKEIPTKFTKPQFQEFVLPYLKLGSRGPQPKLDLFTIFNYILKLLYLGCQWKELPIDKDEQGIPEIHYTRIYRTFRRFKENGCLAVIFEQSVLKLS